jgi:indole-3-glycerol phosphate synthase
LSTILDKIIAQKREEIKKLKNFYPLEKLKEDIKNTKFADKDFYGALSKKGKVNIIAEVKRGSPSKGIICHDFNPVKIAKEYESAGACAISVLTDIDFFYGSINYLKDVKESVNIPVLRKDFIIDEYQIYEAKAYGADAVLLIAAVLDKNKLIRFLNLAHELGMHALVEVHNKDELDKVFAADAGIIGINNRNLKDFSVDLNTTKKLVQQIPKGVKALVVSESGIHKRDDIGFLLSCGVNAFLIGEALLCGGNITKKMNELTNE